MNQYLSLTSLLIFGTISSVVTADTYLSSTPTAIIITAPKTIQPLWSNTGNYSAINKADIDADKHTHINQILSSVPGVWVSQGSGQEHLTAIRSASLTGPGACGAFLYLQDNVPIRPAGFCNINNLFEVNSEQAESIEVIRGPSSSVFGGSALNGLININSPAPAFKDQTTASMEIGPNDFNRIKISNSLRKKDSAIRLDINSTSSHGYRDDTGYGQQKFTLRTDSKGEAWDHSTVLSGSLLNQETGAYVRGTDAYKSPDLKYSNPSPEAYRDAWSTRIHSKFSRLIDDKQIVITPYWRKSQMDFLMHFLPGTPVETNEQSSVGIQANITWQTPSHHQLTAGMRTEGAAIVLQQTQYKPEVFGKLPTGKQYDFTVDTRFIAAYLGADWKVSDDLHLINSLRIEYLSYDYDNKMINGNTRDNGTPCMAAAGCRYTRPADRHDNFTDGALRIGLNYNLSKDQQLFASVGTGFRPPQATDLYRLQVAQTFADIDSEKLNSIELGINSGGRNYTSQLTLFTQQKNNVIYRNSERLIYNNGATKSEGIELDLNWDISKAQQVVFAGTYAVHQYDNSWGNEVSAGDDMDTAPRLLGQIRWNFMPKTLFSGKSSYSLIAQHTGKYYMDAANMHQYPGHTLLNVNILYRISPSMEVSTRINNLTNRVYAARADFSFGDERYFPGTPRQAFVSFQWAI